MKGDQAAADSVARSLAQLHKRREYLVSMRDRLRRLSLLLTPVAFLLPFVGAYAAYHLYKSGASSLLWLACLLYSPFPLAIAQSYRLRLKQYENDVQEVDFRIDLQELDVSQSERRAEKILRLSDFQLRRYYDLNLSQNSWVFGLGMVCILLGVAVIGTTLFLVIRIDATYETKVITAVLGSIGGILTNFVAAIYLKMNSTASENLASFHLRLVETHRLLLGNLLASRIENDEKRWDTLSQLSLHLINRDRD